MKKLESQLKRLVTDSEPRADFKAALWADLEEAFDRTYPAAVFLWHRAVAVPLALLVIFVSTGAGVYAYASPSVTDAHALWPVKRGIESVEGAWPRKPESAAQFHARMMERRIAEGMYMHHRQQLHDAVLVHVAAEFDRALNEMELVDDEVEVRVIIFDQIERQTDDYGDLIEAMLREREADHMTRQEYLRNSIDGVRVRITESTLDEDEKAELLYRLEFDSEIPRNFEFEFVQ